MGVDASRTNLCVLHHCVIPSHKNEYANARQEIKHTGTPSGEEKYAITANLDNSVQISVTFTKPASAPGFKLGQGENGGFSFFGTSTEEGKRDGLVVHRFHPFVTSEGSIVVNGQMVDVKGDATFIHAIQGMRPDSVSRSNWHQARARCIGMGAG